MGESEDPLATLQSARRLVNDYPERAAFFLARHHLKGELDKQIMWGVSHGDRNHPDDVSYGDRRSHGSSTTNDTSRSSNSELNSLPPHRDLRSPRPRRHMPSTESVRSGSERARPRGPNCQTILVYDRAFEHKPRTMIRSHDHNNWIRTSVAEGLGLQLFSCEREDIPPATFRKSAKGARATTEFVELTWCTPKNLATRPATCFVVDEDLGADVLFADEHVPMNAPEYIDSDLSQGRHCQEQDLMERLHGRTFANTTSRHSSEKTMKPLHEAHPRGVQQTGSRASLDEDIDIEKIDKWVRASSPGMSPQPSGSPNLRATGSKKNSPSHTTVRIGVTWERDSFPVKVDLKGSGEKLLEQLQKRFANRDLDRDEFELHLTTDRDPGASSAGGTLLSLGEDALDYDFENAVTWLDDQRGTKIFGTIKPVE